MPDVWVKMTFDQDRGAWRPDIPRDMSYDNIYGYPWEASDGVPSFVMITVSESAANKLEQANKQETPAALREEVRRKRKEHGMEYNPHGAR